MKKDKGVWIHPNTLVVNGVPFASFRQSVFAVTGDQAWEVTFAGMEGTRFRCEVAYQREQSVKAYVERVLAAMQTIFCDE